ncbi:FliM/FliN family flagellar motor switch protein [Achromobacter xylosoxidans]
MKRQLELRAVDPALTEHKNMLLAAGIDGILIARLERGQRYVALGAQLNGQDCAAFVSLQQLIDYWLNEASLPAEQMDADIAREFVEDCFQAHGLPSPSHFLAWYGPRGMAQRQDYESPLFLLKNGPFDLFLPVLPSDLRMPNAEIHPHLPVDISWSLGTLRLAASLLASLSAGDVIRLPASRGLVLAGHNPILSFHVHGDSLMIDTIPDDMSNEFDDTPNPDAREAEFSVEDLPVTLSFLLSRRTMRVGEVSALQRGMTIPLEQTAPSVDVMAGSMRVARGELVRVGQDLGVEISEVLPKSVTLPGETTS